MILEIVNRPNYSESDAPVTHTPPFLLPIATLNSELGPYWHRHKSSKRPVQWIMYLANKFSAHGPSLHLFLLNLSPYFCRLNAPTTVHSQSYVLVPWATKFNSTPFTMPKHLTFWWLILTNPEWWQMSAVKCLSLHPLTAFCWLNQIPVFVRWQYPLLSHVITFITLPRPPNSGTSLVSVVKRKFNPETFVSSFQIALPLNFPILHHSTPSLKFLKSQTPSPQPSGFSRDEVCTSSPVASGASTSKPKDSASLPSSDTSTAVAEAWWSAWR